jgi:hypothetical protein
MAGDAELVSAILTGSFGGERWRVEHPNARADLSGIHLGAFAGFDLRNFKAEEQTGE